MIQAYLKMASCVCLEAFLLFALASCELVNIARDPVVDKDILEIGEEVLKDETGLDLTEKK